MNLVVINYYVPDKVRQYTFGIFLNGVCVNIRNDRGLKEMYVVELALVITHSYTFLKFLLFQEDILIECFDDILSKFYCFQTETLTNLRVLTYVTLRSKTYIRYQVGCKCTPIYFLLKFVFVKYIIKVYRKLTL